MPGDDDPDGLLWWCLCGLVVLFGALSSNVRASHSYAATVTESAPYTAYRVQASNYCGAQSYGAWYPGDGAGLAAMCNAAGEQFKSLNSQCGLAHLRNPPWYWNAAQGSCWGAEGGVSGFPQTQSGTCPEGMTLGADNVCRSYSCPQGGSLSGTQCIGDHSSPQCAAAGTVIPVPESSLSVGRYETDKVCVEGCPIQAMEGRVYWRSKAGVWHTQWIGPFKALEGGCTGGMGAIIPPAQTPEDNAQIGCIQKGMSWGEVNGAIVCVPRTDGSSPTTTVSTDVTTTKDGSGATTGTKETVNTTTCSGGGCFTKSETWWRDGAGNVYAVEETDMPADAWCAQHPQDAACRAEGSSWGGTCGAYTCEGDAVQCALARTQHEWRCAEDARFAPDSAAGSADTWAGRGRTALSGSSLTMSGSVRSMSSVNSGARISAGGCPPPVTFATPMGSLTLDYAEVICPVAGWFSWIIVASSMLMAVRIVLGGL